MDEQRLSTWLQAAGGFLLAAWGVVKGLLVWRRRHADSKDKVIESWRQRALQEVEDRREAEGRLRRHAEANRLQVEQGEAELEAERKKVRELEERLRRRSHRAPTERKGPQP